MIIRQGFPDFQKGILGSVFRLGLVLQDTERQPENPVLEIVDEQVEGCGVTPFLELPPNFVFHDQWFFFGPPRMSLNRIDLNLLPRFILRCRGRSFKNFLKHFPGTDSRNY